MQAEPLAGISGPLRESVLACARGALPTNVMLMHLAEALGDAPAISALLAEAAEGLEALGRAREADRIVAARRLWDASPAACETVRAVLGQFEGPQQSGDVRSFAARFDAAAARSPEAGSALYALGRPDLLAAATREVIEVVEAAGLLVPDRVLLEIGCGSGRFLPALAPKARFVAGIDISIGMLRAAASHCRTYPNASVLQVSGRDLALFRDEAFDLVLAIDSFPYIVEAGLAEALLAECARVLVPGGTLFVANFSYDGSPAAEAGALQRLSAASGLHNHRVLRKRLRHWDGRLFSLSKPHDRVGR